MKKLRLVLILLFFSVQLFKLFNLFSLRAGKISKPKRWSKTKFLCHTSWRISAPEFPQLLQILFVEDNNPGKFLVQFLMNSLYCNDLFFRFFSKAILWYDNLWTKAISRLACCIPVLPFWLQKGQTSPINQSI